MKKPHFSNAFIYSILGIILALVPLFFSLFSFMGLIVIFFAMIAVTIALMESGASFSRLLLTAFFLHMGFVTSVLFGFDSPNSMFVKVWISSIFVVTVLFVGHSILWIQKRRHKKTVERTLKVIH